jgi:hypothetical protein
VGLAGSEGPTSRERGAHVASDRRFAVMGELRWQGQRSWACWRCQCGQVKRERQERATTFVVARLLTYWLPRAPPCSIPLPFVTSSIIDKEAEPTSLSGGEGHPMSRSSAVASKLMAVRVMDGSSGIRLTSTVTWLTLGSSSAHRPKIVLDLNIILHD